ncbi:putative phage tail protein [Undibacterium sp.]|uniref:YmfQ family protein n=1 Tax=Undibacterium sp. TaxID=1914977 RepID=UPI0025D83F89|nr:putative phage tail protein [Undibacterium sp.]
MNHSDILKRLLPPSAYDPNGSQLSKELNAEGAALDAALASSDSLLNEFFPDTCVATLPDWERTYGLPDSCQANAQSFTERRAALVARVRATGGLSKQYFRQLAADLGYAGIVIDEYRPTTCDGNCGMALYDDSWRGAWYVNSPNASLHVIANCNDAVEGALDVYKTGALECMVSRLKPADTIVVFTYGAT